MKRIYIAGPMTGYEDYNYPLFNLTAADLRKQGYEVINPAENGLPPDAEWQEHMRVDIANMVTCDAVYRLPGWLQSKGARIEVNLAIELGLELL